ncbi:MAG: hypothetical protein ABIS51_23380 [Sphingomonas sp.]
MTNILSRDDVLLFILDIEASALGYGSYPIEVGLALIQGTRLPIRTWSALIRPTQQWREAGVWSSESAVVHNIPFDLLEQEGRPASEICSWLNALLGRAAIVVTDAPLYDQDWLDALFRAGDCDQLFTLLDFDALTGGFNPDQYRRFVNLLERERVRHRAGPDALRLARSLLEAHLGYPPPVEEALLPAPGS